MSTLWGGMITPDPNVERNAVSSEQKPTRNDYLKAERNNMQFVVYVVVGFLVFFVVVMAMVKPTGEKSHLQWLQTSEQRERTAKR